MKILHVISSLLPGGAEKLVTDLMLLFSKKGHEAELAVFNAVETPLMLQLSNSGIRVHRFAPEGGNVYSPKNLLRLQRLVRSGKYDIVHTHNTACQLFGALCRPPKRTKMVTTEHNTSNRRRSHGVMRYTDRLMYAAYDRVVCVSDLTLDSLTEFLGQAIAGKSEVITNGIDLERYKGSIGRIDSARDITVTMVAGFREQKDQDTAVRAIASLPSYFRLRLVGDGVRINEVKQLATDLGVDDRVEFPGFRDDVPELLLESDIVVMSSHYEGLSLSNIEGMASGRPFVASDVAGLHEMTDGAGILFAEGDHKELAGILQRLAEDPGLYATTVKRCRERASGFDIGITAKRYLQLYSSLTNGR